MRRAIPTCLLQIYGLSMVPLFVDLDLLLLGSQVRLVAVSSRKVANRINHSCANELALFKHSETTARALDSQPNDSKAQVASTTLYICVRNIYNNHTELLSLVSSHPPFHL